MRSRSVLVVLSLLALLAAPAEAASKKGQPQKKKNGGAKKVNTRTKKVTPSVESRSGGPTLLGSTRSGSLPEAPQVTPRKVATGGKRTPVVRNRPQSRSASVQPRRETAAVPTMAASRSFDSSAAVAPRKKTGRIKRFFASILVVGALTAGAFGWQAADMNSKVGDAWNYVQDRIEQVIDGNHPTGGSGSGGAGNHGPETPFPDPGPPVPQPDPGSDDPSPSGGHGNQTPQGPDTDNRR
jgi:hypothetical protein